MQEIDGNKNKIDWSDAETLSVQKKRILKSYVTISKRGILTFSAGFVLAYNDVLGHPSHCILSYSKRMEAIIFDFVSNDEKPGSKKLSASGSFNEAWKLPKLGITISTNKMLGAMNVRLQKTTRRYNPITEIMSDGISKWVIYLNRPYITE